MLNFILCLTKNTYHHFLNKCFLNCPEIISFNNFILYPTEIKHDIHSITYVRYIFVTNNF